MLTDNYLYLNNKNMAAVFSNKTRIKGLNDIRDSNHVGLFKNWILKDKDSDLIGDVLQKISFSIEDFNNEITNYTFSSKNVVFLIVLSSWILEGITILPTLFRNDVMKSFSYEDDDFSRAKSYIKALRSFAVAHPLNTQRHKQFNLDGDYVCTDIYDNKTRTMFFTSKDRCLFVNLFGMFPLTNESPKPDFFLKVYSKKKDNSKFFELIGFCINDLSFSVNCLVDYIYALDKYLSKQKKKEYSL